MDWLREVAKLHKEWVKIARVYGAGEAAEDCVQDAYLKLQRYASPEKIFTKGKLNKGYVFFTIKTVVMQYHKDKQYHEEDIPHKPKDVDHYTDKSVEDFWDSIDYYTKKNYDLPKRVLYKMWRAGYNIRDISYCTDVSVPTIVKELKEIKYDIKEKFKERYEKTFYTL